MKKVFYSSIFIIATFFFVNVGLALGGWEENVPNAINSNAGTPNAHYNSGHKRIVRVSDNIFAITPTGSSGESIWRSSNNGASWELLGSPNSYGFSGALISGPDGMIYHFFREGSAIYMVRFNYNASSLPARELIYNPGVEGSQGAYNMLSATIDGDGSLYVATHWNSRTGGDSIFLFRSTNTGDSWSSPISLASGDASHSYGYISLEVNTQNYVVATYSQWGSAASYFGISTDSGLTWNTQDITIGESGEIYNPHILPVGDNDIYVFAQGSSNNGIGLIFTHSPNLGNSWDSWRLIDPTYGYADPGAGLGDDGTIYVAFRSSNGTGISEGSTGDRHRSRLAMSSDDGETWSFPDDYYEGERTGTRNNVRYQTWWNGGGPLEWVWMQYVNGGTSYPIFYDVNTDIEVWDGLPTSEPANTTPPANPSGLAVT